MELEYIHIYYNFITIIIIGLIFVNILFRHNSRLIIKVYKVTSFILLVFSIYYIGSREYEIGVDTLNYKSIFDEFSGGALPLKLDIIFYFPFYLLSHIASYRFVLYLIAFLYLFIANLAFKKLSPNYNILYLLLFVISPYFLQYGINGLRNGVATSIFILGLAFVLQNNKKTGCILLMTSCGVHLSMLVPLLFYILFKKVNLKAGLLLFLIWITVCFFAFLNISLLQLDYIVQYIPKDLRIYGYLASLDSTANTSSIINYALYGLPVVLLGFLYIYIYRKADSFYLHIYYSYLFISVLYLLLITIPFSNRIAYLSDFLIPIIALYPLVSSNKEDSKQVITPTLILLSFLFVIFIKS